MTPRVDFATRPDFAVYLAFTALVCGAMVMMVEVLGARLISPFFGVGLFVWTSLIGVTLAALAVGYLLGGLAADRLRSPDYLYSAIIAAGFMVAAIPLFKAPVLKLCVDLGLRGGALASAFLLFAPALMLLGAVSPYLLKIAAREVHNLGRTAGGFYALSTLGSFLGTLATGFYLIGVFGVDRIFLLAGTALVALGAGYFVVYRRKWVVALVLAVPLLAWAPGRPPVRHMADGTSVTLVHSRDSFYGNVKVVDYVHGALHTRELIIDGLVQGGVDLGTGQSVYEYAYLLQHLPRLINPEGRSCLVIGLGAGMVPRWYLEQGVATDVVDIDAEVVRAARLYFALDPALTVFVEDARHFLVRTTRRYDYVVLDVFNGDTTPGHLLSVEAMQLIKSRMTAQAVLAVNLVGDVGPEGVMTASVVRTMREVFGHVEVRPTFVPARDGSVGNLVLVAHSGGAAPADGVASGQFAIHPLARSGVLYGMANRAEPAAAARTVLLTDDFNPIDLEDLAVKERVRRQILESTDWDILLGWQGSRLRQQA